MGSAMQTTQRVTEYRATASGDLAVAGALTALSARVRGEYREMPGLRLTVPQAARLFGMSPEVADAVLRTLRGSSVLTFSSDGTYSLVADPSRWRAADASVDDPVMERTV
jgi:hypothetical protein